MNVGVLQTIPIFVSDEIFRMVGVFNISDSIPGCRPYSPFGIYIKLIDGIRTKAILAYKLGYAFIIFVENEDTRTVTAYP